MIRSSRCHPWQPDQPGLAGDRHGYAGEATPRGRTRSSGRGDSISSAFVGAGHADFRISLNFSEVRIFKELHMRNDLDHLPPAKQRELERVVQVLFEEFEEAHSSATGDRRKARIRKIILYGSHARGGWVDEPHTAKGYQSDFDLLIIVNQKELTDRATYWYKADERLMRERAITKTLHTPVNFIVHTLQEVNDGLAHGRYFFMDVAKEGIALYESDDTPLHEPKPKTPDQAYRMAKEYFEEWFPSAARFLKAAKFLISENGPREAAFNLHQATERLYHCALLVCTFYGPLCRARHKAVYAERRTMPHGFGKTKFPKPFEAIHAA